MGDGNNISVNIQGDSQPANSFPSHPITCIFEIFFKVAAITSYEIAYYLWDNFVGVFVLVVTLLALDFYTSKNVTGRFLVGLRWWNQIKEDGTNLWRFESIKPGRRLINPKEKLIFWIAEIVSLLFWVGSTIFSIFKLRWTWLLICLVGLILNSVNIFAYVKCARVDTSKMQQSAKQFMMEKATDMVIQNAISGKPLGSIN